MPKFLCDGWASQPFRAQLPVVDFAVVVEAANEHDADRITQEFVGDPYTISGGRPRRVPDDFDLSQVMESTKIGEE